MLPSTLIAYVLQRCAKREGKKEGKREVIDFSCLVSPHVVSATIGHVVVDQLQGVKSLKTITLLVDLGVVGGAGLTHLVDSMTEEVLVGPGVIIAESLHEVGVVLKIELDIKNIRAGTALLDTVVLEVSAKLGIVVVEGVLEIRILVVIEVDIEDKILRSAGRHGRDSDGAEAHGGDHALSAAHVTIVPGELNRGERGEERIDSLVDLGVVGGAGLTHLLHTVTEEVLVGPGVIVAESLHEVGVVVEVEGKIKDVRASTALLDTVVLPVGEKLGIVVVESILEIRILVVVEVDIEDNFFHVDGRFGRNTRDHFFLIYILT